jgi:uncharacterized protein (UPF0332 family)
MSKLEPSRFVTLPRDLLDQADLLASKERRRPKQASLRRAISTAYYALFHLLIEDAANALSPTAPAPLRKVFARAFQHGPMKTACKDFVQANTAVANGNVSQFPKPVQDMLVFPLPPALLMVLTTFVELQEARHTADYDLTAQLNRLDVLSKILTVRNAFAAWSIVRKTESAAVFMASMLIRKDWAR